jgi:Immunoglobulin I-set domain
VTVSQASSHVVTRVVTKRHILHVRYYGCRLKGRRPLGDDVTYEISCEEKELYTLTIDSAFSEHAGWFTCMAANAAGTALTEAKLTVERESIADSSWGSNSWGTVFRSNSFNH